MPDFTAPAEADRGEYCLAVTCCSLGFQLHGERNIQRLMDALIP